MKKPLGIPLFTAGLACFITWHVTWPHTGIPSILADHFDPYFSVWRISRIAHALASRRSTCSTQTSSIPAKHARLLGCDAAPGTARGAADVGRPRPSLVYNVLFLAGFIGSGVAMFVLARHVTGDTGPALVAAAVFTILPYRVEHMMHLELQWAMFVPFTFWAVMHRTMESGRSR